MAKGDLVYFMFPVTDGERAQAFFGGLFGWEYEAGSVPGGTNVTNSTPPGGIFGRGSGDQPVVYFEVDEIEAACERVRELGGIAGEVTKIESGWIADCRDDQGTHFSIWQGDPD
jgi:predicted enzyme related to lactoylglutathione lyase